MRSYSIWHLIFTSNFWSFFNKYFDLKSFVSLNSITHYDFFRNVMKVLIFG